MESVAVSLSPLDLQQYLLDHIAIYRALGAQVRAIEPDSVTLIAPLGPNLNHHGTVFGGSASALAILTGWSLLYSNLAHYSPTPTIVIQRNSIEYRAPISSGFEAQASFAPETDWGFFLRSLTKKGRARAAVEVTIISRSRVAATFRGAYVAQL